MKKLFKKSICTVAAACVLNLLHAQDAGAKKATVVLWDGMAVAGYVNQGAFVNFGGPTVRFIQKPVTVGFGILPTMRIKKDPAAKDATKNSVVTPTAGFGLTFIYKHIVMQVPFYYNSKTATANGKWHPGIGIGYKF